MPQISELSALELVNIIAIKQLRLQNLSKWKIISRYRLKHSKDMAIVEFLNRSIFDKIQSLAAIILKYSLYDNRGDDVIKKFTILHSSNNTIVFILREYQFESKVNATIEYNTGFDIFKVNIESNNTLDATAFEYNPKSTGVISKMWVEYINQPLNLMIIDLLQYAIFAINRTIYDISEYIIKEEYINQ